MFIRILKKDLKRKKTMNLILLMFIILAAMFLSSGLNNVITVLNGTEYYLDKAGIGDYVVITMGDDAVGHIKEVMEKEECVNGYEIESVVFGAQDNVLLLDGGEAETKNTVIFQPISGAKLSYFDTEDNEIKEIEENHVYVSGKFLEKNNLKAGDKIKIKHHSIEMELVISGKAKDALLGSDFMGNQRFILNENDYEKFLADEEINAHYLGEIGYIRTDDTKKLASVISDIPGAAFTGARSLIKMCYVMDMIVAFIILILSICLIIVSFVVLKFSINFTIMEEFREIGVMKAIGIPNGQIRSLYIVKYLMLSVLGAVIGFFASLPFGKLLLKSVSENMVLGNDMGVFINIFGAFLVIVLIILFAYECTGKVKKSSPIDAIRSGQTGERYKKKSIYRIKKSHAGASMYLAVNDVLSSLRQFLTIIISFFVCTLFVLMVANTTQTMESPNLADTFGKVSDLYITDVSDSMKNMTKGSRDELKKQLDDKALELTGLGMPADMFQEIQYKYKISFNGNDYMVSCQQGVGTKAEDYRYLKGDAPRSSSEIAITLPVSEMTGAKIGDTVTIDFGSEKKACIVTGYFQTLNNLGELIRLHEDAPVDFKYISSILQSQIKFTDNPDKEEIERRKERIKDLYHNEDVMNVTEYCVDCIGVVDTMKAVQNLLFGITLVVVLLVTILMERSFIANEKNQIGILKAIGFNDRSIILWQTYRFGIIAFVSVILAAAASIPMTKLCISPIFGMMGAGTVKFNINVWQIFVAYPLAVFLFTLAVAWATSLYTKTITSRDIANIE